MISEGIGFPRLEGLCIREVGSRDTTVLMENNEGSCLFAKLKEAAALRILLPQGPASPLFPMGQVRPANEPCLKPSGEWAFLMCN